MYRILISAMICFILGVHSTTAQQDTQKLVDQYIEFYYPTTGAYFYEIAFDWGMYMIDTGHALEDSVHVDSERYKGYITLRPFPNGVQNAELLFTYIVLTDGDVWRTDATDMEKTNPREEVVIEKDEYGTSTMTTTINSYLEPVVDHYLSNPTQWEKYGSLVIRKNKYVLNKILK